VVFAASACRFAAPDRLLMGPDLDFPPVLKRGGAMPRFRTLIDRLIELEPHLPDPENDIRSGHICVNGIAVTNPRSLVSNDAALSIRPPTTLRGELKLAAAFQAFDIEVQGRVALDVGAAAGGFTKKLLDFGVKRVYAVDVGHGQLLGSLRNTPRVINLEKTNLAQLDETLIPDTIELVTLDLSYLALTRAVLQLESVRLAQHTELIALVKPQFELGLAAPPTDSGELRKALQAAVSGIEKAQWRVAESMESPIRGERGSMEFFVRALRQVRGA
jgi:23S rRNA (cytidine1920-2'-O)/16S rRNA (cytidine1409-2'-O)-methyltransferase